MAPFPKHHYRLQGYVDPEVYHVLFDTHFVGWGMQTRIIRALLRALASHVTAHCDPHLPLYARLEQLDEILAGVRFGQPARTRGQRNESRPTPRTFSEYSDEALSAPSSTTDLVGGEYADTQDPLGWQGPGQEEEALPTAR